MDFLPSSTMQADLNLVVLLLRLLPMLSLSFFFVIIQDCDVPFLVFWRWVLLCDIILDFRPGLLLYAVKRSFKWASDFCSHFDLQAYLYYIIF